MYLARLLLPANLEEHNLEKLGPALDGLNTGYYAARSVEHDENSVWYMRWITETHPDISDFSIRLNIWAESQDIELSVSNQDWDIEKIDENKDWLAESYQGFKPFTIEDFFIFGSHHSDELPENKILLQIDAATAFGSGEHPTTEGCLKALLDIKNNGFEPATILDMGCGSGILAIAAAKLFPLAKITAIDIDEEAINVTARHQKLNHVEENHIESAYGDGFDTPLCQQNAPYDLVIANILAGPLKEMSSALQASTSNRGSIILSGLLNEQAQEIISAYSQSNLKDHKKIEEWSTLTLRKNQ